VYILSQPVSAVVLVLDLLILVGFKVLTKVVMKNSIFCFLLATRPAASLLGLFYGPEDGSDMFLRNAE
jgi:hypothetical protein